MRPSSRLSLTPRAPRFSRALLICLFYGGLSLLAVGWGSWRGHPNIYQLDSSRPSRLVMSPLLGVGLGLAIVFLSRLAVHQFEWARVLHREFHSLVHELTTREIVLLAASSSVAEELFFRGALLPSVGLLPSSLLFAVLHVRPQRRFVPWTLMSFAVGLLFGVLFLQLGDLGAPIAAHFTINLLNLNYIAKTELRV